MVKAVKTFTKSGSVSKNNLTLDDEIFNVEIRSFDLLKNAYHSHLAKKRNAHAKTQTRSEVRGGGRKPWKQKGTGRARHGSIRSPIWKGGGVVFGPTGKENYQIKLHKKAKKRAIKEALTLKQLDEVVYGINSLQIESGKTQKAQELLDSLNLERKRLIIIDPTEITIETQRAFRNIPDVTLKRFDYLSVFHIINADNIVITKSALQKLPDWLLTSAREEAHA